eukprot:2374509-Pleurochrysis_carterae.AAC.2
MDSVPLQWPTRSRSRPASTSRPITAAKWSVDAPHHSSKTKSAPMRSRSKSKGTTSGNVSVRISCRRARVLHADGAQYASEITRCASLLLRHKLLTYGVFRSSMSTPDELKGKS